MYASPAFLLCLGAMALCFSCAATPREREPTREYIFPEFLPEIRPLEEIPQIDIPVIVPEITVLPEEIPEETPERPVVPPVPELIMGEGLSLPEDLMAFLNIVNPEAEDDFVENLAIIYTQEAAIEGVNHDVAFAQMCLETGFLRYGGLVTPDMNNFCGLGSIGPGQNGESFPDARTGVRAHIQHLKAYATTAPLEQELVDPRFMWVRFGSSPTIKGLAGTWAADREYAEKIKNILERLYRLSYRDNSL